MSSQKLYVVNTGRVPVTVPIVSDSDGSVTEVQLQPGGKPFLPEGYQVSTVFLARNPQVKQISLTT